MSVTVSGIMINPVGEPVVNAQITLTAIANSLTVLNAFSATVRTDNIGAYRIQLEEGSYSITVAANGRSFVYGAVTLDNTTGPSTLNQLLKQQIMESELTPDVILYFRQIQQQVANDLATIKVLESSATGSAESAGQSRDEARQYASNLSEALATAKGYRDQSGASANAAAQSQQNAAASETNAKASKDSASLSEQNALLYRDSAQSAAATAADDASTLAAELTAAKITLAVKTDADRAVDARTASEQIKAAVDSSAQQVAQQLNEATQAASAAKSSKESAATSEGNAFNSATAANNSKVASVASAETARQNAVATTIDQVAAKGFRDEAEEFAEQARVSAESIDVSALDEAIAGKASNQALSDGLAKKLSLDGGIMTGPIVLSGDGTTAKSPASMAQLTGVVGSAASAILNFPTAGLATGTFTADEVVVGDAVGLTYRLRGVSAGINISTVGAGGMDTGTPPTDGFVSIYVMYNPTTKARVLLAQNTTGSVAPLIYSGANAPAGYTASALVSVWPLLGIRFRQGWQRDRRIVFPPFVVSSGTIPVTSQAVDLSTICPKNAKTALVEGTANAGGGGTSTSFVVSTDTGQTGRIRFQNNSPVIIGTGDVLVGANNTVYFTVSSAPTQGTWTLVVSGYTF